MKLIFNTDKDFDMQASAMIKKLRSQLGISQKELAKKLDVSQARVSYIEKGKSSMTISMFQYVIKNLIAG